ncbi:MAG TPA: hypothetical protein VKB75_07485, partial [Jatrophihabitans sp.]|nr:hypothetical protein [Jatrophihabitans sp.]
VPICVTPNPVPISGTLTVDPFPDPVLGSTVSLAGASIQVVQQPPGSGAVNVSVSPSSSNAPAQLVWNDSSIGTPNLAQPGTYKLQVSLAGYAPAPATVQCTTLGQPCTFGPITLEKLGSLTINTVTQLGVSTQPVPDAAVSLRTGSTSLGTQTPTPGDNSVTFTGLTPGKAYVAHIQAAGYTFGDAGDPSASSVISLDCGSTITITAGNTTTCTATLTPLGAISGTVRGFLGVDTTAPANVLGNATLTAQRCAGTGTTGAQACTGGNPNLVGPQFSTVSKSDGSYRISGSNSVEGLQPGWWQITASAPGYHSCSAGTGSTCVTYIDVTQPGIDTAGDVALFADNVNLQIQVLDGSGKPIKPTTAQPSPLTFSITDTATSTTLNAPTAPAKTCSTTCYWDFGKVIPTSYSVTITGSSIPTINTTITLAVNVATQQLTIRANASTGSVSGTVTAPQGASQASTGLNGVTVSLGHFTPAHDPTGTFQVTQAADGSGPLTTQTPTSGNTAGFFSFASVPLGSYDVQVSPPAGYFLTSSTAPQVNVLSAGSLVPVSISLDRVTRDVTVQVTTSTGDVISGAAVSLTPSSPTDNPTFASSLSATKNGPFATSPIKLVPFGTYTVSITLPADRFGTFSDAALSCSSVTTPTPARLCTGSIDVPTTVIPDPKQRDLLAPYTLNEFQIGFRVTATALSSDGRTTPGTVQLAVKDHAANGATVYTDATFAVGTSGSTFIWVPDATPSPTYDVTATPDQATFPAWPAATLSTPLSTAHTSGVLALQEVGATVNVTVTDKTKDLADKTTASVTLTAPDNSQITWTEPFHTATGDGTAAGDAITTPFSDVPFATGWTVTATIGSGATQRTATAPLNIPADCGTPDAQGVPTCTVKVDVP